MFKNFVNLFGVIGSNLAKCIFSIFYYPFDSNANPNTCTCPYPNTINVPLTLTLQNTYNPTKVGTHKI